MVKFGTYHSQNFVFSIPNFWKLFKKSYSTNYLEKMKKKNTKIKDIEGTNHSFIKIIYRRTRCVETFCEGCDAKYD